MIHLDHLAGGLTPREILRALDAVKERRALLISSILEGEVRSLADRAARMKVMLLS
jgi:hypothetical protein